METTLDSYGSPNWIVLIRWFFNKPPPNRHKHTDMNSVFFLLLHICWTVKRHPVFACSGTEVLPTIDMSLLIDFCTVQLLCHCYVIVLRCFYPDHKNNFSWLRMAHVYDFLSSFNSQEVGNYSDSMKNRESHRKSACDCNTHTHRWFQTKFQPLKVRE